MAGEQIYWCQCGFKCLEGMLAKTGGSCPVCKKGREDMKLKYKKVE